MSKKKPATIKYTPSAALPKLSGIKTTWNLSGDYYKSTHDPKIEEDIVATERAYEAFAKRYRTRDFTGTNAALLEALTAYESLSGLPAASKPGRYFWFRMTKNAADSDAQKKLNLIEDRLTKAGNKILFFQLQLGKMDKKRQKEALSDPKLAHYHYFLTTVFDYAKHLLTEPEEKILSLKSDVSHGLWVNGTDTIMNKRTITFKKEVIPLASATDRIETLPSNEKPKLWNEITTALRDLAEIAENELNAIVINKKINDELRGYPHAYTATIKGYENDEKSVLALVDAISTKGFALSKKYYALKAKLHGVKSLPYANRNDVIGEDVHVPFEKAVEICRDTFYGLDPEYGQIFDTMLTRGAIDVYPEKGKSGGAFCAGDTNMPTYVMLNQVDNLRSFTTLAHEMGHAIHTERSKTQSPIYERYSTTTAETASTLFEGIASAKLLASLSESEQIAMLDRKIGEVIATICRQIAFFNFEKELHETIRREGAMTWQEMAKLLQKHLKSYMGAGIDITEKDGLSFIYIGHFRNFFYVYTYAYGELMSNLMSQKLAEDPSYIEKIDTFLCSGGKDTVENIFKAAGINPLKIETFEKSLQSLADDIARFEKLTRKLKKA